MENRFKKFGEKEIKIGTHFAKLFHSKYEKTNDKNITDWDGKINSIIIEIQELRSTYFINKLNCLCLDTISSFKFLNNKRKNVNLNDKDIKISKLGKIFELDINAIYLIVIEKKNIENIQLFKKQFIQMPLEDNIYIYFPINMNKINKLKNQMFNVNNKNNLNDTWESAYTTISFKQSLDICYSKNELENIL